MSARDVQRSGEVFVPHARGTVLVKQTDGAQDAPHTEWIQKQAAQDTASRATWMDFWIGLHLLGPQGRSLLAHYITTKRSQT